MLVDSHCHIDGEEFDADRADVLRRAHAARVESLLIVGTGDPHAARIERAVWLAETYADASDEMPALFASVGVHPHDARLYDDQAEEKLLRFVASERVIAWGEIGLDYHYDHSPREVQHGVFRRQLRLARERDLPVIIHTREAESDTIAVLEAEFAGYERAGGCGVMHCFGSSMETAERAMRLGFLISFAGNLTFKKAEDVREVARTLPLDRMMVETDAPYLAPVPFRGKRNEPAYVREVARTLARLHDTDEDEIARRTTANFRRLFRVSNREES